MSRYGLSMGQLKQETGESANSVFVTETISMNLVNIRRWAGFGPVKDVVNRFAIDLVEGRVISCDHLRNPQTVIVGMAVPDRMYCRGCAQKQLFSLLSDPLHAGQCDACGESAAALHETTVNVGSLMLIGIVCCGCNRSSLSEWAS